MEFRSYYQQELESLIESGRAFSKVHGQARHLAQRSEDPAVERLLEGFSFLSAKIHARLDQGQPDVLHPLVELMAPHLLKPIPSCTMVQFSSDPSHGRAVVEIPAHTELHSIKVQGVPLKLRTTQPIRLLPIRIASLQLQALAAERCRLDLELEGTPELAALLGEQGFLDLHLNASSEVADEFLFALHRHCEDIVIEAQGAQKDQTTRAYRISPKIEAIGLRPENPLLPWDSPSYTGQRLATEFFTLPDKFRQFRIHGLEPLRDANSCLGLRISFFLDYPAQGLGTLSTQSLCLHCSPAINLFACDADPLQGQDLAAPQRIRACGLALDQFEVYQVQRVTQLPFHQGDAQELRPWKQRCLQDPRPSFRLERRPSSIDGASDAYLRMMAPGSGALGDKDLLSLELLCTNRHLCEILRAGDIQASARPLGRHVRLHNLRSATPSYPPALQGPLLWRLCRLLCAQRKLDLQELKTQLELLNPAGAKSTQGQANRQLIGTLQALAVAPMTGMHAGIPVPGQRVTTQLDQAQHSVGQLFVFGEMLHALLHARVGVNQLLASRTQLHPSGRCIDWH